MKQTFTLLFSAFLLLSCGKPGQKTPLLCYVGGTMRPAMEEIAKAYEAKTGRKVLVDYAGSGELLVKMQQTRKGDLYVSHDPFPAYVFNKDLGKVGWTVAVVAPVIVVPKGNPKNITGLKSLARPGTRLVLSHEHYSTVGHLVPAMAEKAGIKDKLEANVVSRTRGGGEAANAVMMGTADASIVWQAVAHLRKDKLDAVPIEPEYRLKMGVDAVSSATFGIIEQGRIRVTIAVVKYSKQPKQASAFAEFTASKEAAAIWEKQGFDLPEGGAVKEIQKKESLIVHCAAGMRKPVEILAGEFGKKWGARMELSFDGSNRLLGQIKLTRKGDVYIAGDADYIDMAEKAGLVRSRKTVCFFMPVIMVPKGNPGRVRGLNDLLKAGVKIGVGDEKAAAVGRITPEILKLNGIDLARWKKNIVLATPTVNELGLAVKLGTVDAALVWRSVAKHYPGVSDIVTLDPEKNVVPAVEGAVLDFSESRAAAAAFLDYLTSERGRAVLTENGYLVERPE